jgi:hypothetical protein
MRGSVKRMMGFEPTTFLHGKPSGCGRRFHLVPLKCRLSGEFRLGRCSTVERPRLSSSVVN